MVTVTVLIYVKNGYKYIIIIETAIFYRGSGDEGDGKDHVVHKWIQTVRNEISWKEKNKKVLNYNHSQFCRSRYLLRMCTDFYKFQCTMESSLTDLRDSRSVDSKCIEQHFQSSELST